MPKPEPLDQNSVGSIGLLMVADRLLRNGFSVCVPMVDTGYDLIAGKGRRFWRLQVKSTGSGNSRVKAGRGAGKRCAYSKDQCDAIVAVHVVRQIIVCVLVENVLGRRHINFSCADPGKEFDALR